MRLNSYHDNQIMVSIICNTYNHEEYIEDALKGFIIQKTNFMYEVLVHDDASTDNTVKIIRKYEKEYPNIIKPIYEKNNLYSKKDGSIGRIQYGRVKGKYIAFCEGDDYWTDSMKLQKQFDILENNPEYDMCAHSARKIMNGKIVGLIEPKKNECVISPYDVIIGGGAYFATNSLFYRSEMRKNKPQFIQYYSFDYPTQIWGSLRGGIYYLPDCMSTYRVGVRDSWTDRMHRNSCEYFEHEQKVIKMLEILDEEYSYRYHDAVNTIITKIKYNHYDLFFRNRIDTRELYNILNELPLEKKIRLVIKIILMKICNLYAE